MLNQTRVILITHLHGDHFFGTFKILLERDRAQNRLPEAERTPVYCVFPSVVLNSIEHFIANQLVLPDLVKVIDSSDTNPEPVDLYSH